MKIIVLNCGSSSIKYQLFQMDTHEVLAKGVVEKIGLHGSFIKHERNDGDKVLLEGDIYDHQAGIEYLLGILSSAKHGSIKSFEEIEAVGHRVVHGGEKFKESVLITDEVIKKMEECIDLAPLHNPPNLKGIYAMQALLPNLPQVGTFDTAFHQTMPDYAYMYAIPYSLYKKLGIRRYGFHGSSHRFVSKRACDILGVDFNTQRIITCHLGNGGSVAAIKNGESVDTSMGMTPVEGLVMGTRCGDMDLGVLTYLMMREELDVSTANTLINKHCGLLGITGVSSDMREIIAEANNGNERAKLGLSMFQYRIKKYIGSYAAIMNGVDIIVFTGGIGENNDFLRENVCNDMEYMGIEFDSAANKDSRGVEKVISKSSSKVKVIIVPTNEELVIAEDTREIIEGMRTQNATKLMDY
jgi:acetate kinase